MGEGRGRDRGPHTVRAGGEMCESRSEGGSKDEDDGQCHAPLCSSIVLLWLLCLLVMSFYLHRAASHGPDGAASACPTYHSLTGTDPSGSAPASPRPPPLVPAPLPTAPPFSLTQESNIHKELLLRVTWHHLRSLPGPKLSSAVLYGFPKQSLHRHHN